jgi:hypothetical protein
MPQILGRTGNYGTRDMMIRGLSNMVRRNAVTFG